MDFESERVPQPRLRRLGGYRDAKASAAARIFGSVNEYDEMAARMRVPASAAISGTGTLGAMEAISA